MKRNKVCYKKNIIVPIRKIHEYAFYGVTDRVMIEEIEQAEEKVLSGLLSWDEFLSLVDKIKAGC